MLSLVALSCGRVGEPAGALTAGAHDGAVALDQDERHQTVWWLNIPQCGNAFAESVQRYREYPSHKTACCMGNTKQHKVLPQEASDSTLARVAAIFRNPQQRMASAYYYIKRTRGRCCDEEW